MNLEIGRYLLNHYRGVKRGRFFPIVLMLEVLEACNLRCIGCGRVLEYKDWLDPKYRLTVDRALEVAEEAGTPVVSVTGGEPLMHPEIGEIVQGLVKQRRWVYLCTNGTLLKKSLEKFKPDKRLRFVVHLDGTAKIHDRVTRREGTYNEAVEGIKEAIRRGFRVCTNTTVFHGSDVEDLGQLFRTLSEVDLEGTMLAPGYAFESVPQQDLFLHREQSIEIFRKILTNSTHFHSYDNPLFMDFLRGARQYNKCAAWATPTYTILGWRKPCYLIADEHVEDLEELLDSSLWERFGPGKDPRCTGCMLHSGFEPASVLDAVGHPWKLLHRPKA
jgi:hopanoid biosynthesis associated radical SAM protein HpnH